MFRHNRKSLFVCPCPLLSRRPIVWALASSRNYLALALPWLQDMWKWWHGREVTAFLKHLLIYIYYSDTLRPKNNFFCWMWDFTGRNIEPVPIQEVSHSHSSSWLQEGFTGNNSAIFFIPLTQMRANLISGWCRSILSFTSFGYAF